MPLHMQRGLALIGFGLLIGFFGLIWVANLFGVVDEHAKRTANSRWNRWWIGYGVTAMEMRTKPYFRLGRYLAGGGFMLVGLLAVTGGVMYLIAPPTA